MAQQDFKKQTPKKINPNNLPGTDEDPKKRPRFNVYWIYGLLFAVIVAYNVYRGSNTAGVETNIEAFKELAKQGDVSEIKIIRNKKIVRVSVSKDSISNKPAVYNSILKKGQWEIISKADAPQLYFTIGDDKNFTEQMENFRKENPTLKTFSTTYDDEGELFGQIISTLLPILLIGLLFIMMMRKVGGSGGGGGPGGIFNIGKSKATLFDKGTRVNINFGDVAGLDEAKVEVMEIVDFLKNPKKYTALGGKIPKGALLIGPPGTGKTLLAKAVAGEAQVPFFSLSGSDFVEMFVGVGASRVRDLFKQAREKAPCIIFIDEIDAIGRARGKNMMMSNDERENTLNQLLVEMDGFGTDIGIIILAATNRPDVREVHREAPRVQELPIEAIALRTLPSVHRVANDRESSVGEVDADLVRPAGHRSDMEERPPLGTVGVGRDARKSGRRLAAARPDDHPPPVHGIAADRRLDDDGLLAGVTPDQGEVFLLEPPALELPREGELGDVVLRDDHHATGVLVEPVHDPRTCRGAAGVGGDLADDRVHQRAGRVPMRRVHDEPRWLVHHEHVVVLIEHIHRDVLAEQRERGLRVGYVDHERFAHAHLVGRFDRGAVHGDAAVMRKPLDRATAELGPFGQESIDPLSGCIRLELDPLGH